MARPEPARARARAPGYRQLGVGRARRPGSRPPRRETRGRAHRGRGEVPAGGLAPEHRPPRRRRRGAARPRRRPRGGSRLGGHGRGGEEDAGGGQALRGDRIAAAAAARRFGRARPALEGGPPRQGETCAGGGRSGLRHGGRHRPDRPGHALWRRGVGRPARGSPPRGPSPRRPLGPRIGADRHRRGRAGGIAGGSLRRALGRRLGIRAARPRLVAGGRGVPDARAGARGRRLDRPGLRGAGPQP